MATNNHNASELLTGMFLTRDGAERAVNDLHSLGYAPEDISIILNDDERARKLAADTGAHVGGMGSETAEGAGWGAGIGGTLGAIIVAATATTAATAVAVTGGAAAPFVVGPLVAVLAGVGAGGVAGGIVGWLIGLGFSKESAEGYGEALKNGGILIAVYANEQQAPGVREVLEREGAAKLREQPVSGASRPLGS